jgi:hypothetical protein
MIQKERRGQSALEFLTTYGWAFLVILVMIGALAYFGVLDPSRFLPDKCIFGAGIGGCTDIGVTTDQVKFKIINSFGKDIVVNGASVSVSGLSTPCLPAANELTMNLSNGTSYNTVSNRYWASNMESEFAFNCSIAQGERPSARVSFSITQAGSTNIKNIEGEVSAKR